VRRARFAFILAGLLILVDQGVKALILLAGRESFPVDVIPGFFRLTFTENRGGVFGMLHATAEPWRTLFLVGVPLAAIVLITVLIVRSSPEDRLSRFGLALILGGAIGNQIDRLRMGFVLDYLDFYAEGNALGDWLLRTFGQNHWYNFNVADMGIVVGAGVLLTDALLQLRPKPAESTTDSGD
jgi:signal peptidase II